MFFDSSLAWVVVSRVPLLPTIIQVKMHAYMYHAYMHAYIHQGFEVHEGHSTGNIHAFAASPEVAYTFVGPGKVCHLRRKMKKRSG